MRADPSLFRAHDEPAGTGFKVLELVPEPVRAISREEALQRHRLFRGRDGFVAAIPEAVVEALLLFAKRAAPKEWIGTLMVELCEDKEGRFVLVQGVVPDTEAVADLASVKTTTDSEFRTRVLAELLFPTCIPGGWAHSHPRYGVWFSDMDRKTQSTWTEPHALGIVVDPWDAKELAVYRGPGSELLEYVGRVGDVTKAPLVVIERPPLPAKRRRALEAPPRQCPGRNSKASSSESPLALVCLVLAVITVFSAVTSRRLDELGLTVAKVEATREPWPGIAPAPPAYVFVAEPAPEGSVHGAAQDLTACLLEPAEPTPLYSEMPPLLCRESFGSE